MPAADALSPTRRLALDGCHGAADLWRRGHPPRPACRQVQRGAPAVRMVVRIRADLRLLSSARSQRHELDERVQSSPKAAGAGPVRSGEHMFVKVRSRPDGFAPRERCNPEFSA